MTDDRTDGAPDDAAGEAFADAVASYLVGREDQFNYAALVHTFTDVDRFRRWARLLDRLRPLRGATVLSSGCGAGGSLVAYHEAGAVEVHGVEVQGPFVHMSLARTGGMPGVHVHHLSPEARLPLPDRSIDVVESMDVIEHTPNARRYMRELRRVLSPGGIILVVTPNRLWPVEQHLGIVGPPWLPVGLADAVFGLLARLPWLDADRRSRYRQLRGMRTHNMSLRQLRRLARELDLELEVLHRAGEDSPIAADDPRAERLLRYPLLRDLAPVKTLSVILHRRP